MDRRLRGFTLIELLLVLGIMASIMTGVWLLARNVTLARTTTTEADRLSAVIQGIDQSYANADTYAPDLDTTVALNNGALPVSVLTDGRLRTAWNQDIGVSAISWNGTPAGAVLLDYPQVDTGVCARLVPALSAMDEVRVNGSTVWRKTAPTPVPPAGACASQTGTVDMAFVHVSPRAFGQASALPDPGTNHSGVAGASTPVAPDPLASLAGHTIDSSALVASTGPAAPTMVTQAPFNIPDSQTGSSSVVATTVGTGTPQSTAPVVVTGLEPPATAPPTCIPTVYPVTSAHQYLTGARIQNGSFLTNLVYDLTNIDGVTLLTALTGTPLSSLTTVATWSFPNGSGGQTVFNLSLSASETPVSLGNWKKTQSVVVGGITYTVDVTLHIDLLFITTNAHLVSAKVVC
jgi:prepilin-type N-terminal cleavage/methylation domain-containing protein